MTRTFALGAAARSLLVAVLILQRPLPAQQSPARKSDSPQPAGDAVAPRAGEKKSAADAPNANPSARASTGAGVAEKGTVRTMRLPEFEPELPEGKARNTVVVVCGTCHSTRYIMIQPPLPRETWVAEVTKMQKTYGAPVPPDKVEEIVDYLVAVRGPRSK